MNHHYSLIEYKLRRYFYLGHEYSMYIPFSNRKLFWKNNLRHLDYIAGVRIIGKIIMKNNPEEINSIVPIILKINNENNLVDDQHLIFALAVCTKFNLKQCVKMVSDAYKAISSICTDGLKLLMFVKFSKDVNVILLEEGYISSLSSGNGNGFRKAIKNWYLKKDPLLATEQIVKDKYYRGWNHRNVMKMIRINSKDPSQLMFIVYTIHGMEKVEELFGPKVNDIQNENDEGTFEHFQLRFIYNYLKQVNSMKLMSEITLLNEIELQRWGHEYKVIPREMLQKPTILASLVRHMPLRDVLDKTLFFAQHKLFIYNVSHMGLWEYILRFNNTNQLRKHRIHPIESYLEYVKYSRTYMKNNLKNIVKRQNGTSKRQGSRKFVIDEHKLQYLITLFIRKKPNNDINSQIMNTLFEEKDLKIKFNSNKYGALLPKFNSKFSKREFTISRRRKFKMKKTVKRIQQLADILSISEVNNKELIDTTNQLSNFNINNFHIQQHNFESVLGIKEDPTQSDIKAQISQNESPSTMVLFKPPPKLVDELIEFLSKDLIKKTLKILEPTDKRILIILDNRKHMMRFMCAYDSLISVHEAITLITLSLIMPEKSTNKPIVYGINEESKIKKIEIDYDNILLFKELDNILFKESLHEWDPDYNKKYIPYVHPLSIMTRAREKREKYDVFVFLGTNKMNYDGMKYTVRSYRKSAKKPIKIIICCLNGKHSQQRNLSRGNMLFISGFDKNVGKIIHSFITEKF